MSEVENQSVPKVSPKRWRRLIMVFAGLILIGGGFAVVRVNLPNPSEGWIEIQIPKDFPPLSKVDYIRHINESVPVTYKLESHSVRFPEGYLGVLGAEAVLETEIRDDSFFRVRVSLSKTNNWEQHTYRLREKENGEWKWSEKNYFGGFHEVTLEVFSIERIPVG